MKALLTALALSATLFNAVQAEEKANYDRLSFSVTAEKDVANDTLTAVLYAEQQGQDTAAMADTVNKSIVWALEQAKGVTGIEHRTLDYTTTPMYTDSKVTGWQVRQSIQLTSKDSKTLSTLLGKLQEQLRIEGLNYSVSKEVRTAVETELVTNALANFKTRAEQMKTNLGRANYRIVRVDVQNVGDYEPPVMYKRASDAMPAAAPAAPQLEAGKQNLKVNVQAEIELSSN